MTGRNARRGALATLALLTVAATAGASAQEQPRQVTLEEAIEVALRNNPDLAVSRSDVDAAEYDRLGAWGDYLPTLSLGYGYSNASTARLDPTQQSLTRTSYTLQLGATYEIFDGFRRLSGLDGTELRLDARRANLRAERFETRLDVERAFYDAVARRELVRVEEDRLRRQRDQLDFVEQQLELGRANRSDLLRSRVDVNNARLAVLNAENEARAASFRLAQAMGVRERVAPVSEASLAIDSLPFDRDRLVTMALETSPVVEAARADAEAAEAEVATARSSYLPDLTFRGGWAWQNDQFPPENRSWSIALQGSLPLFDGFQRETRLWKARARSDAAEARSLSAELEVRTRLDEAFSQVQSARVAVEIAEQSVELSREDLRVSRERYRLGLADILDLQSAQIALRQAEVDLVQRRFDHRIGVATLESLVGRSLAGAGSPDR